MLRAKTLVLLFLFLEIPSSAQRPLPVAATQTQVEAGNPVADARAIVIDGNVRFTVLTPQLVRLEWAENAKFEDHASLMFINRRLPVPQFTRKVEEGWLVLTTAALTLRYRE